MIVMHVYVCALEAGTKFWAIKFGVGGSALLPNFSASHMAMVAEDAYACKEAAAEGRER